MILVHPRPVTIGYHISFPPSSSLYGFLLYLRLSTRYSYIHPACRTTPPCRDNCSNVRESELFALFATISPRYGGIAATTLLIVSIVRHLIRSPLLTLAIIGMCICGSISYTFRFTRPRLSFKSVKRSRIGP